MPSTTYRVKLDARYLYYGPDRQHAYQAMLADPAARWSQRDGDGPWASGQVRWQPGPPRTGPIRPGPVLELVDHVVTLYETNADNLVIGRGGEAWNLGPITPDMHGTFADDASSWLRDVWAPSTFDGQTRASADGLTPVAHYSEADGMRELAEADRLGAAATLYLTSTGQDT